MPAAPESEAHADGPAALADQRRSGWRRSRRGPNWEEILGGEFAKRSRDVNFEGIEKEIYGQFENTFMMYLPRLCEHCLNPGLRRGLSIRARSTSVKRTESSSSIRTSAEAGGCASPAAHTRRSTTTGSPGKSEKCIFCYPRIEAGEPTVCSETCVGRIRYLGVVLYDADRIEEAASVADDKDLYEAQLGIFLDPDDPAVHREGARGWRAGSLARGRETLAGVEDGDAVAHRLPAPSRIPHSADGLVRAAAFADPGGRGRRHDRRDGWDGRCAKPPHPDPLSCQPAHRGRRSADRAGARADARDARLYAQAHRRRRDRRDDRRPRRHDRSGDRADVPSDGDRQLRGPVRHPDHAPRGGRGCLRLRGGCGFTFGNGCSGGETGTGLFGSPSLRPVRIPAEPG